MKQISLSALGVYLLLCVSIVNAHAQTIANLIVNGDAEVSNCSADWKAVTTVPGWRVTKGSPTAVCYTAAAFYTPNPAANGKAFFADGPYGDSAMVQYVDLSSARSAIDGGAVTFSLSGWLGGYGSQSGEGRVSVAFVDRLGKLLTGGAELSGDTPAARKFANKFITAAAGGVVPSGARTAVVTVRFINTAGSYNVGYVDNLSLTLSTPVTQGRLMIPPSAVPAFDHVFIIMMENTDYNQVIGDTVHAPYINSLVTQGTLLTNSSGTYHPSDENYLAIAGGDAFVKGPIYFPNIKINAKHIGDQIEAVGKTWKAYEQGMGTPCNLTKTFDQYYYPDDAPFINFTNISGNLVRCALHLFDTTQLDADLTLAETTPNFSWIAADDYYDGEASGNGSAVSVGVQDTWLRQTLQPIFESPAWLNHRSLLILTWDESSSQSTNHVATIILGSQGLVRTGTSPVSYNHYNIGRTIESALGVMPMTINDQYAFPVNDAFNEAPASLSASATSVVSGQTITFNYTTPIASQNSKNWIGLYKAGSIPGKTASLSWRYVTTGQGQLSFSTSGFAAGSYFASYFFNDGYTPLAGPIVFDVTP